MKRKTREIRRRCWGQRVGGTGAFTQLCVCTCTCWKAKVCVFVCVECLIRLMRHGKAGSCNIPHRSPFTLLHINIYSHSTPRVKTPRSEQEMKRQRSALKLEEKKGGGGRGTLLINPTAHKQTRVMKPGGWQQRQLQLSGPLLRRKRGEKKSMKLSFYNSKHKYLPLKKERCKCWSKALDVASGMRGWKTPHSEDTEFYLKICLVLSLTFLSTIQNR